MLPVASQRSQKHQSKDLDSLPIPFHMGPQMSCPSKGTNLCSTLCNNPMTWPPKPLSSEMSVILCYQRCHSSSTPQERWPRHPLVFMDHRKHWGKPVMMRNVIWASQGSRKETQCLLELSEKQNFPPTSPSRWGLSPFIHSSADLHPVAGGDM